LRRYNSTMLTLAILAGGRSKRMGQDKANLSFAGKMLVLRIIDRLRVLTDEVIIITSEGPEALPIDFRRVTDLLPGRGPLGALYTALFSASHQSVAVVACDMPFVNPDLLAYQQEILFSDCLDAVVPRSKHGLEPLHGIYRQDTCLPAVRDALKSGKPRLVSWFPSKRVRILTESEIIQFDPDGLTFLNINTPAELARAELLDVENNLSNNPRH
jgi:molybdopterin-guanine dinucleotide biosynthesis protein A